MSDRLLLLIAFGVLPFLVRAQAQVCADGEQVYSYDCRYTCISCDLDGISGKVDIEAPDERFGVISACFSGSGNVIGFMSLDTNLTIQVTIGNCEISDVGTDFVEVLAYEPIGNSCFDESVIPSGTAIFDCDAPSSGELAAQVINANSSKVFESIVPLRIGGVYFLEITTTQNASCEYTIDVLEGDTRIPNVPVPDLLYDMTPCLGETVTHQVANQTPLTTYIYTLNGDTISSGPPEATVTYDLPGSYELCVQADNGCSRSEFVCRNFRLSSQQPVVVDVDLCPDECFSAGDGQDICTEGEFAVLLFNQGGCDSTVLYRVTARERQETEVVASVCAGDSLFFNGAYFRETGNYPVTMADRYGCDSTVVLKLSRVVCPVLGRIQGEGPVCFGQPGGNLTFTIQAGVPPFDYSVALLGSSVVAAGTIAEIGLAVNPTNLLAGTYLVSVTDNVGAVGFLNITLVDPEPLRVTAAASSPTCFAASDGNVRLETSGGQPPYSFSWQGAGDRGRARSNLVAGRYEVTVADAPGCSRTLSVTLTDPPPFTPGFTPTDEACADPGSGSVRIDLLPTVNATLIDLATDRVVDPTNYAALTAGSYRLEAVNDSGCVFEDTFSVDRPEIPQYRLYAQDRFLALGRSTEIGIETSTATWRWLSAQIPSPLVTDPTLEVSPPRTTIYPVEITASSGCTVTDSVTIIVDRTTKIYVPTAFSPNGDGVNDRFLPFSGPTVDRVVTMDVYDRWGGEIYAENPTNPDVEMHGWDGTVNDRKAPAGTYAWQMTVRLVDGDLINLNGIINLIR